MGSGVSKEVYNVNFHDDEIISAEKLNENRKQKKFTDLILIIPDGTKFYVHKMIISTRCPYFEGLFNSELKESEQSEIQLDRRISSSNFEAILTYIYTGTIEINTENAFVINEIAYYFGLKKLKEASENALIKNINLDNILILWRWAEKFSNTELVKICMNFILENARVFFDKYTLGLDYKEVQVLASKQDFDQDLLYTYLTKWIKEDFNNRQKHIVDLLKSIDFVMLSDDIKSNQIKTDTVLLDNKNFLKLLTNSLLTKANNGINQNQNAKPMVKMEKITTHLDELVFAISSHNISVIKFNKPHPRFIPVAEFELNKTFEPIYNESDNIFFCGLEEGRNCKNFRYRNNDFINLSPMIESRTKFGIVKVCEKIFVCGGKSNNGSVEIYDINADKWMYGKLMSKQQLYGFKVLNYNQCIYAFGGSYEYGVLNKDLKVYNEKVPSRIIQRYDPRESEWETISTEGIDMPYPCEIFGINDSTIRCIFKGDKKVCGIQICDYDVRNNAMSILPIGLPEFDYCVCCQYKDHIFLLTDSFLNKNKNVSEKKFVRLNTRWGFLEGVLYFTELPDLNLNSYLGCKKLLSVGPDQYNYLNSIIEYPSSR